MEDQLDEITTIEIRHRKEKKELQAKVQSLKKTVKGDKTKKKEVIAEINKLETELEERHKKELENCKELAEEPEDTSENIQIQHLKPKVTKAQRRRDKKLQQERDQAEQVRLQEIENLHGPRNIEMKNISLRLKEKQLMLFSIPSDGDCLYKAVSHQLETIREKSFSIMELRNKVAKYIKENKTEFLPFMSHPDTYEMLTDDEFEDYCNNIINSKSWGGQLEIRALSSCLRCPIHVIQATGPVSINQGDEYDGPPLIITYHRHMYKLGEHYNSTKMNTECLQDVS
ncbi:Deubiquitinase OTUD6B [Eumeta japonica]|uniref:ubiquitinyl hydrolase 1 n=1 Tax=Eumeta variegata TaxID=151549 RepID=A0A4C1XRI9_EUMVA|nr:Deubiquitinase OTUD6B [Eumeta japonica]